MLTPKKNLYLEICANIGNSTKINYFLRLWKNYLGQGVHELVTFTTSN